MATVLFLPEFVLTGNLHILGQTWNLREVSSPLSSPLISSRTLQGTLNLDARKEVASSSNRMPPWPFTLFGHQFYIKQWWKANKTISHSCWLHFTRVNLKYAILLQLLKKKMQAKSNQSQPTHTPSNHNTVNSIPRWSSGLTTNILVACELTLSLHSWNVMAGARG